MPSMTNYQAGDLVLIAFPYVGDGQAKNRPALIILDTGDADLVLARVTTQPASTPFDVQINDWQAAGLLAPSSVRLHKLATLDKNLIRRRLGSLAKLDRQKVSSVIRQTYGSW